jgi:hypothetical protein
VGLDGKPYRAIGDKTLLFLDGPWKARKDPLPDLGAMISAGKTVRFWADPHFDHENLPDIGICPLTPFAHSPADSL